MDCLAGGIYFLIKSISLTYSIEASLIINHYLKVFRVLEFITLSTDTMSSSMSSSMSQQWILLFNPLPKFHTFFYYLLLFVALWLHFF